MECCSLDESTRHHHYLEGERNENFSHFFSCHHRISFWDLEERSSKKKKVRRKNLVEQHKKNTYISILCLSKVFLVGPIISPIQPKRVCLPRKCSGCFLRLHRGDITHNPRSSSDDGNFALYLFALSLSCMEEDGEEIIILKRRVNKIHTIHRIKTRLWDY